MQLFAKAQERYNNQVHIQFELGVHTCVVMIGSLLIQVHKLCMMLTHKEIKGQTGMILQKADSLLLKHSSDIQPRIESHSRTYSDWAILDLFRANTWIFCVF